MNKIESKKDLLKLINKAMKDREVARRDGLLAVDLMTRAIRNQADKKALKEQVKSKS